MSELITFEFLREIQLKERKSKKLSKLPSDFYESVWRYIQQKRKILEKREDRKVVFELRNVERMVEEIFERRERKIMEMALNCVRSGIEPENLLEEEKKLFDELVASLKRYRKTLEDVLTREQKKIKLAVFKQDFPQFVGANLKKYGPFRAGDIAKIPEENLKILEKKGIVESFEVEE